jgi:hypothetical protein
VPRATASCIDDRLKVSGTNRIAQLALSVLRAVGRSSATLAHDPLSPLFALDLLRRFHAFADGR